MTEEKVDLVDEFGIIRAQNVPRSRLSDYSDLYLQIIIAIIFDKEGNVLIHKRAKTKKVNPGDIDYICGAIVAGETPEMATVRESIEEAGLRPNNLQIVDQRINSYKRYRYFLIGETNQKPKSIRPDEVEWTIFIDPNILINKTFSKYWRFVNEFFADTQLALQFRNRVK